MTTELRPCIVTWEDAYSIYSPTKISDYKVYKPCMRRTIGFILFQDERRIVVASTDDRESVEQLEGTDIAEITIIPAGMVRSKKYLAAKTAVKARRRKRRKR